jgi:fluoride exporter
MSFVWVFLGGGLGAAARYAVSGWIVPRLATLFPVHTALINVSGSFAIGVLVTLFMERAGLNPAWRLLVVTGFLGGYTTFSTYSYEAVTLAGAGEWRLAAAYVLGSTLLGLVACIAGIALARTFVLH